MIRSPDGDTDFVDIIAGVLQGNTLAIFLFIIGLHNVQRTSIALIKEKSFHAKNILKKQEADDIPQKLLRVQTTQMI